MTVWKTVRDDSCLISYTESLELFLRISALIALARYSHADLPHV